MASRSQIGGEDRVAEALYNNMRTAIQKKDHQHMREIVESTRYDPNRVGGGDQRTALHTAAQLDDKESLLILLGQPTIDTNVRTSKGLTPFLLAASKGKMVAFEVLLNDKRVEVEALDDEDQSALELINSLGKEIKAAKAKELLEKRNKKRQSVEEGTKLALLIGNSEYRANNDPKNVASWDDLPGAMKDVLDMKARLEADGYQVEVIANSSDILQAVQEVMNKTPVASVTHLQVLYAGKMMPTKRHLSAINVRSW